MTAKPLSIKGTGCKFGGCVRKVVELTSGDLPLVPESGLRERSLLTGRQKTSPVCDEQAGIGAAPGEDADGELEPWEGELCILGLHDSQEAEHTAESAVVLYAAVAVAQGDEASPETRA